MKIIVGVLCVTRKNCLDFGGDLARVESVLGLGLQLPCWRFALRMLLLLPGCETLDYFSCSA